MQIRFATPLRRRILNCRKSIELLLGGTLNEIVIVIAINRRNEALGFGSRTLINVSREPLNFRASVHKQPRERRSGFVSADLKGGNYADKAEGYRGWKDRINQREMEKPANGLLRFVNNRFIRHPAVNRSTSTIALLFSPKVLRKTRPPFEPYLAARDLPRVQNSHGSRIVLFKASSFMIRRRRTKCVEEEWEIRWLRPWRIQVSRNKEKRNRRCENWKNVWTWSVSYFCDETCAFLPALCFSFNYWLINNFSAILLQRIIYLNKNFNWYIHKDITAHVCWYI